MAASGFLTSIAGRLLAMVYPEVCAVCHATLVDGEEALCLECLARLPRTGYHKSDFNQLHTRLASTQAVTERAGAWFHYMRSNPYAAIIHDAKYRGLPHIARACGKLYAREIASDRFFEGVDMLLPVPMHRDKERRRGYNQAREIAVGISAATGIPVADNLVARRAHDSQTSKSIWQRWVNARTIYGVNRADELTGRHVMIVDDVITTGATMLACLSAVTSACAGNVTLSVVSLAATSKQ